MTAPTKSNSSPSASRDRETSRERPDTDTGSPASDSRATLDELARAQDELTQEMRELVARDALADAADDDRERTGRIVTVARAELLERLRDEEQVQARRQLAQATRSSEEAVAGVVQSVTTVVRTLVPAALVRPDDLIEAIYTVADQGLKVSRRLALSVSSGVRSLTASN